MGRRQRLALIAAALTALVLAVGADRDAAYTIHPSHPPRFSHLALIVLENRGYRVIGSSQAPYLRSLARRSGLATHYFGIGHPSLPNYLALTMGRTFHLTRDCRSCQEDKPSLFDQLTAAGISWKAYFEGDQGTTRIDPFLHYEQSADGTFNDHLAMLGQLNSDIANRSLPQFSWLGLDLCNDGHSCSIGVTDSELSSLVPPLLHALGPQGALFITWDEGTTTAGVRGKGGGHIPLIAAGGAARPHARTGGRINHYALLHTIERSFGLPPLHGAAAAPTRGLFSLFRPV
jgi:hypothetical protein